MAWNPPYDYVQDVWLTALRRTGISVTLQLMRSGWFPIGQGEIQATVSGLGQGPLRTLDIVDRGRLLGVAGRALAANLPVHIAERMSDRACGLVNAEGIAARVAA
jgi:RNA 3'-terminal phosphate cyclase (ATP)